MMSSPINKESCCVYYKIEERFEVFYMNKGNNIISFHIRIYFVQHTFKK